MSCSCSYVIYSLQYVGHCYCLHSLWVVLYILHINIKGNKAICHSCQVNSCANNICTINIQIFIFINSNATRHMYLYIWNALQIALKYLPRTVYCVWHSLNTFLVFHLIIFCDDKNETHKGKGFYFYVPLMKGVRYWIKQRVYLLTEQSIVQPHCFHLASLHIVQFQSPLQTVNYIRAHPFTRSCFRILYFGVLWSHGTFFSPWCLVIKFY